MSFSLWSLEVVLVHIVAKFDISLQIHLNGIVSDRYLTFIMDLSLKFIHPL